MLLISHMVLCLSLTHYNRTFGHLIFLKWQKLQQINFCHTSERIFFSKEFNGEKKKTTQTGLIMKKVFTLNVKRMIMDVK